MYERPQFPDPDFTPDPASITRHRGAFYNPWINIPVALLLTFGSGALTLYLAHLRAAIISSPPYPDQSLDSAGALIGIIAMGLATIGLVGASIYAIIWWSLKRKRHSRRATDQPPPPPGSRPTGTPWNR
ncbi:hypothetical protein [Ruania alba]|uniref:hypothetical protein n=1 Tax=Ruania alba TaxID=648782 RepID=UPI000B7CA446|nr:hypothetical protein [Ruania alba]